MAPTTCNLLTVPPFVVPRHRMPSAYHGLEMEWELKRFTNAHVETY